MDAEQTLGICIAGGDRKFQAKFAFPPAILSPAGGTSKHKLCTLEIDRT